MRFFVQNFSITTFVILSGILLSGLSAPQAQAGASTAQQGEYTLDPTISGDSAAPYKPEVPSRLSVDKRSNETRLHLETEGQVAPYIGAGRRAPPSEGVVHLLSEEERSHHNSPHLETGVGVNLTESTNFNLGYRVGSFPSHLEEKDQDNGQVRFGIDFRFPAD